MNYIDIALQMVYGMGNVLGFDPTMVNVYRERDIRGTELQETKASTD